MILFMAAVCCVGTVQTLEALTASGEHRMRIDNRRNVMEYPYNCEMRVERNTIPLKNCIYAFRDDIDIPGMPQTVESDFLNHYIFSESQCPQGLCMTEEFVLLTSYSEEDENLGELMVFDRESGEYLVTLGMDAKSHLGGIAYDGKNVWVCNSSRNCIERISYDFVQLMARKNSLDVVDASDVVDIYPVNNKPSCITCYGGRLWIATHTLIFDSKVVAYHYNEKDNELLSLSEFAIPSKVQGLAFDDDGSVYLSTSYGRNASSYLKVYSSVAALSSSPGKPSRIVEMPPGAEEVDEEDGMLYVIFESAGRKYYYGTDGKGQSHYPIDRILTVEISSIYY